MNEERRVRGNLFANGTLRSNLLDAADGGSATG